MFAYQVKACLFNRIKKTSDRENHGYVIPKDYNKVYTVRALELQSEKLIVNTKNGFVITKYGRENFEKELARIEKESEAAAHVRQSYVGDKKVAKTVKNDKSEKKVASDVPSDVPVKKGKTSKPTKKSPFFPKNPKITVCTDPSEVAALKQQALEDSKNEPVEENIVTAEPEVLEPVSDEPIADEVQATA